MLELFLEAMIDLIIEVTETKAEEVFPEENNSSS